MEEIQGKYLIKSIIPETYTLTGNDRNAELLAANDSILSISTVSKPYQSTSGDCIKYENNFVIKRARIYAAGGAGMQPEYNGDYAAILWLFISQLYDGSGKNLKAFVLRFPKWGEWIEINNIVKPHETTPDPWTGTHADTHPCRLKLGQGSRFTFDDYNVQSDYIGQDVTPVLEMEVYTGGMIDMQTGKIY